MKSTASDISILGGQGSIGSRPLAVANPAPGQGPSGGDKSLSTEQPIGMPTNSAKPASSGGNGTLSTEYGDFTNTINGNG